MEIINKILNNTYYIEYLNKIKEHEKDREFCKHDINHFLDVARLAYILNLENDLKIDKEIIYATALLHDIGRWKQYEEGIPHEVASSNLSTKILESADFSIEEIQMIKEAILNHRNKDIAGQNNLMGIIYRADKTSRKCFSCKSELICNWSNKNMAIKY